MSLLHNRETSDSVALVRSCHTSIRNTFLRFAFDFQFESDYFSSKTSEYKQISMQKIIANQLL